MVEEFLRHSRGGAVPHTRISACLRIPRTALDSYIEARTSRKWCKCETTNRGPRQLALVGRLRHFDMLNQPPALKAEVAGVLAQQGG